MKNISLHILSLCGACLLFAGFSVSSAFSQPDPRLNNPRIENPRLDPKHDPTLKPEIKDKRHHDPKKEDEVKAEHDLNQPPLPKPHAAAPEIKPIQHEPAVHDPVPEQRVPRLNGPERIHHGDVNASGEHHVRVSGKKPDRKFKHGNVMKKGAVVSKKHPQFKKCVEDCRMNDPNSPNRSMDECRRICKDVRK